MNRNMAILFSNATVLPMTAAGNAPRTFAGWVGVDGNRIALVTESETAAAEFRAAHPGLREFDCRGKLVMPGLVNTHCHAAMTLQRSLADDIALMEWLHDYIWPFEARQTADDVALGMTLGVVEMLLGGVTSVRSTCTISKTAAWRRSNGWASAPCWAATTSIRMSTR